MKKTALFFFLYLFSAYGFAQNTGAYIRPAALGFSYNLYDFTTPQRIRASSLSTVLREKQTARLNEMGTGLAVSYFNGLRNKIDFAGTLAIASADYTLPNTTSTSNSGLLMQADASLQFKMVPDNYLFIPYLAAGLGASKYGVYYGAFMPVGVGFRLNFFDEASVFVNARYHIPITDETVRSHLVYGFGIAGIIASRKTSAAKPAL